MRAAKLAIGTVLCALAFSILVIAWSFAYVLEGALDRALVWLVDHWPEG